MDAGRLCRACLAPDIPFNMNSTLLRQYESITGLQGANDLKMLVLCPECTCYAVPHITIVDWADGRPLVFCWECAARVAGLAAFRDKCHRAHKLLSAVMEQQDQLAAESIISVDRMNYNLMSTLSCWRQNCLIEVSFCDTTDIKNEASEEKEEFKWNESLKDEYDVQDASDDDVPLVEIKNESSAQRTVKQEMHKSEIVKRGGSKTINTVLKKRNLKPRKAKEKRVIRDHTKKRGAFKEDFATEILLTKEQQLEELNQRATTLNYLNSPFKCTMCYKGFVDDAAYRNHMAKHDVSSGEHACDICRMRYTSPRRLRAHCVSSHARRYACRACSHVAHTANQAREHERWHKGHVYGCGLCGETFHRPTSHLTHMRKRHPTEFVCDVCGDSFVGRHGLMMHKQKTHKMAHVDHKEGEAPRALERYCRECDVEFTSVAAWRRHTVTSSRHALDNHFGNGCRVCGERFDSREQLALHSKQHAKRAPRAGDERAPDFTPTHLQCDQCPAKFVIRSKLLAHVRRVHLGLKYNKNIVCELCGKSCTSNATLKYHQRTHTGERPFACAECPKRFSDRNQLRIHVRTHTDERPYSCAVCRKTFRQKPALNRHARVHTGAKPYECQFCGKTFSQSNSLKIHVHTVHHKLPPLYRGRGKPPAAAAHAPSALPAPPPALPAAGDGEGH